MASRSAIPRTLPALLVTLVLAASTACDSTAGEDRRSLAGLTHTTHEEVLGLRGRLEATAREIDEQIRYANHIVGWMLELEVGGSAELLDGLAELTERPRLEVGSTLAYLVESGEIARMPDQRLAVDLSRFYRDVQKARRTGSSAHRLYVERLDLQLDHAVWSSRFEMSPGAGRVDFGEALRELRSEGFVGPLRHHVRGMTDRAAALRALIERTDPILRRLEELSE